jgi:hypothetical protein
MLAMCLLVSVESCLQESAEEKIVASKQSKQSKGGDARAKALSKEERSAIARRAAEERWDAIKNLPKETHAGVLQLGDGIPCSVLDNKMRVFSVNGLTRAFRSRGKGRIAPDEGAIPVPPFLAAANVQPFIGNELERQLSEPVSFRSMTGGRLAFGYEATILRQMCDVLLDAREAGVLRLPQLPVAQAAESLVRALADFGIIALVDAATGYDQDQAGAELRRLIEAYVVEDMRPWAKLFPDAFFKQVYRIHGWEYKPGVTQGPRYVGKFINKYVYSRLPQHVVERLRELSPVINKRRKHHLHRFLTEDIGEPTVDRHLASVVTLMSVASEKKHFDDMFRVAFPGIGEQMILSATVKPPLLQANTDESQIEPQDEQDPVANALAAVLAEDESLIVDGVPMQMSNAVGGVRERIMAAMQGRSAIKSTELARLVYGDTSEATMSKLRVRLGQYKQQGVIESPSKGMWRLR